MEEAGFNACILQYAAMLKDDFCHPAIYRGWSALVVTAFQQRSDFVTTKNKLSPMGGILAYNGTGYETSRFWNANLSTEYRILLCVLNVHFILSARMFS